MLSIITTLLSNPCFLSPAIAWLVAQVSKTIIHVITNREFRMERMVGGGGMPSSHSATVCALVSSVALEYGADGYALPLAIFFAFIVMYDAMGVRRETGEQAKVLNEIMLEWRNMGKTLSSKDPMEQFKEFVGHTPLQVLVGAILGIVIGCIVCSVM